MTKILRPLKVTLWTILFAASFSQSTLASSNCINLVEAETSGQVTRTTNSARVLEDFLSRHEAIQSLFGRPIFVSDKLDVRHLLFETGLSPPNLPGVPYVDAEFSPSGKIVGFEGINLTEGPLRASSSDSFALKDLVFQVLRRGGEVSHIYDLGAGNSLATIAGILGEYAKIKNSLSIRGQKEILKASGNPIEKARCLGCIDDLKAFGPSDFSMTAIDNIPEALELSRQNAASFGLIGHYAFLRVDMMAFLQQHHFTYKEAIVSNPPYLPVPPELKAAHFDPVNGGELGDKYIQGILNADLDRGTLVGILWSSLTNPVEVIRKIESDFEVVHSFAYLTPFGVYTESGELFPYLGALKKEGRISFSQTPEGQYRYQIIGTVLRRK